MAASTLVAVPVIIFFLIVQGRMTQRARRRGGEGMSALVRGRAATLHARLRGTDAARLAARAAARRPRRRLPVRRQHRVARAAARAHRRDPRGESARRSSRSTRRAATSPGCTTTTGRRIPGNASSAASTTSSSPQRWRDASARELRAVGVQPRTSRRMSTSTPTRDNPVIGVRSFGADPAARRAAHARPGSRALQSTGVAASAKHFPGHGDTAPDSHLALPVVDLPLDDAARARAGAVRGGHRGRRRARS